MSTRILLTALFATALTMPALAQPATPPPAEQPAAAVADPVAVATASTEPAATAPATAPATVNRDKDTLSVDFPDEDIKTILRNVADLFELNIVVPDTLVGKTSIKLREVTWHQIFRVVLAPVGYTFVEEGNIIKVLSNELLQAEPVATEVFVINNAKASDIKPTIDGLVDAATGGKIYVDARSNALVITERPSRMGRIRSIIDQLDKATDQVMIESKFVEVTDRDIRNIGVNWASLGTGVKLGTNGVNQTFARNRDQSEQSGRTGFDSTNSNTSNTSGSNRSTTTNSGSTTLTEVSTTTPPASNVKTNNIVVTGTSPSIINTTTTTTDQPATTTNVTTTGTTGGPTSINDALSNSVQTGFGSALQSLTGLTNTGGTSRLASAVFSASEFNVVLTALKSQNNTKVVSNPTVVTLNNTEAQLNIAEEFPLPSYTYNEQTGRYAVSGFTYKAIGIILKVTPQVNARGIIKLNIEPEVSQRNGISNFGDAAIPIIGTRKAKTQVSLKDGYTMGIGGLIASLKQHGGTKVPVLGSIPVLGRLFSSKSVDDTASNLLIFVTAKTVSADGGTPEEIFDPRAIQATGMTRDDMPGFRSAKGAEVFAPVSAATDESK